MWDAQKSESDGWTWNVEFYRADQPRQNPSKLNIIVPTSE